MRTTKRWLALMLMMSVVFSDCGGMTALATQNVTEVDEELISEDQTIESKDADVSAEDANEEESTEADEETDSVDEDAELAGEETDSDVDSETEFPALHIGQIKDGEEFPSPDDSEFVYDLPVSFEKSDSVLLFANYHIDIIPETEEKGTLVWSILRGEKGMEEGSASLVKEEDDWAGFEVVSDSPYFTMIENENEEDDYYQTVVISAKNFADDKNNEGDENTKDDESIEDYNYYIRAAWYFGTEEEMTEEFYTAATVAFLPQEDAVMEEVQENTDIEEAQDDVIDAEEADTEQIQDDESVTEETDEEAVDDTLSEEEIAPDRALEDVGAENITSEVYDSDDEQDSDKYIRKLILNVTAETPIEMQPGDKLKVTATIASKDVQTDFWEYESVDPTKIVWESSDENVAAVETGMTDEETEEGYAQISANAEGVEGYAQITAQYDDLTAVVVVKVVREDVEQILNLAGDIWIVGFKQDSEDFVYSGQKITQDIRVYHNETLLKEKTDYTVTYKNNVNAAAHNSSKAPSMTVKLKGQYSGSRTLYFTILPRELEESMGYEQVVTKTTKLKIPVPTLYYNNKKLTSKKDFTCDYTTDPEMPDPYTKGELYDPTKVYTYTVNGIGNFTGKLEMSLRVVEKTNNLDSATVTLGAKKYVYPGRALTKEDVVIKSVKAGGKVVDPKYYTYEVDAEFVGTGYVIVSPSAEGLGAGYRGMKKISITVTGDRKMNAAKQVEGRWLPEITFSQTKVNNDGGMIQAKEGVLVYVTDDGAKEPLVEGTHYTVKYSSHKKVGTATATFTGKGRYTGTLKLKYKITPNDNKGEGSFTILWKNVKRNGTGESATFEIAYQKGGAVPDFVLKDQDGNVLKNKTDYTVTLRDNKTPGTAMTCEINGKGNYKGYQESKSIMVTNADISKGTLTVADKPANGKANAWKSNPTIKDVNGKKLVAGTDYDKVFDYTNTKTKEEITSYPEAGTEVTVTVHGINNYEGSIITGTYRIYKTSISKLKITIDAQEYTGKEITLTPIKDIHVYANSSDQKKKRNEIFEDYYKIIEYKNNTKAGTAKVTLQGIGEYGGTKTYSFKIKKKTYLINQVKGITLDKTSIALSIQGKDDEKRILTATLKSADATERLANPTVIWTSSNNNIAAIEGGETVVTPVFGYPITYETTVTAHIILKKTGSVTITATAQDGGKKAKCTVNIVDAPILEDADRIIEMNVSDTYKLKFENDELQELDFTGVTFTSSHSDRASITNKGQITAKKAGVSAIKVTKGKYIQRCYVVINGGEEVIPESYLTFEQTPGSTDDTEPIRNCIKRANNTKNSDGTFKYDGVYIPAGVYWIDATANANYGIFLDGRDKSVTWDPLEAREKFEIRMSPGALLMTKGNNKTTYHVITIYNCKNITVSGGTIIGERNEHTGSKGEWGHGIGIYDSSNIHIDNMDISQCWGDGIYLGTDKNKSNTDIKITNCIAHNNRRSNLSITSANGVTIDNCRFNYAKGTDPQYGIDIETNNNSRPCKNITISNTIMEGNAKASMGIITPAENVRLEYCTLSGHFYNKAGKNVVLYHTTVKGDIVGDVDIK